MDSIDRDAVDICRCLIYDRKYRGRRALEALLDLAGKDVPGKPSPGHQEHRSPAAELRLSVIQGDAVAAAKWTKALLGKKSARRILSYVLLPAMDEVGRLFRSGRMQLPFVLRSAEAMKAATAVLASGLGESGKDTRGTLVLATVRGDIHDIGKDLVDMVLSANGYRVINLGVKKTAAEVLAAAQKYKPDAIGLSGLLVESARAMMEYLDLFERHRLRIPVICGGAALSRRYVEGELAGRYRGRVYYAADAMEGLAIMGRICRGSRVNVEG